MSSFIRFSISIANQFVQGLVGNAIRNPVPFFIANFSCWQVPRGRKCRLLNTYASNAPTIDVNGEEPAADQGFPPLSSFYYVFLSEREFANTRTLGM